MGNPSHYSLELPQRCLQILDELWPHAEAIAGARGLGPPTSTFLISMAMPIVNIPIERIERHRDKTGPRYANDRPLDPKATERIDRVLGRTTLAATPFYVDGAWSYTSIDGEPVPNIAKGLPDEIASRLDGDEGRTAAAGMPTSQWCSILRNSLAHGGIAYLDENGRSRYDTPVEMYCFASGRYGGEGKDRRLTGVNLLRIGRDDFRTFLKLWVEWLVASGVAEATANANAA